MNGPESAMEHTQDYARKMESLLIAGIECTNAHSWDSISINRPG